MKTFIIAEAGSNHCGDMDKAKKLIEIASDCGADAVKFQTFTAKEIASHTKVPRGFDEKHDAWLTQHNVQYLDDLFHKGGLPREWHITLRDYARNVGIEFMSTAFSVDSAKFLVEEIGVKKLKIASGDLTFTPLLRYANSTSRDVEVIISTGSAYLEEVHQAVSHLQDKYNTEKLSILHCVSVYPCDINDINLQSMLRLVADFPRAKIGLSDHTTNVRAVPCSAVTLGARMIEKHIDDYDGDGVDSNHSIYPYEFSEMVSNIKDVEKSMGLFKKEPNAKEMHDRLWARRDSADWLRPTREARNGRWE